MEITLKNVKKKDLPVLKALAKRLGFEICIKEDKKTKTRKSLSVEEYKQYKELKICIHHLLP